VRFFIEKPEVFCDRFVTFVSLDACPTPSAYTADTPATGVIVPLKSITERLDLTTIFNHPQPIEVELGSGDGSFLVNYARLHPKTNLIGVERLLGRIRKMERKSRRVGLTNLRGLRIESSYFLQYLLPPHSAVVLHIYFPDPWPKQKHRRHRLINDRFPTLARQALMAGGRVFLRTDHEEYFEQMQNVFHRDDRFREIPTPDELSAQLTDFELEFQQKGIRTLRAAFQASG